MKCEDYLEPEGIETRVYGTVYDSVNDIPIADYKLVIVETNHEGFSMGPNENFIQNLDSAYTDQNGFYDITFTTSGRGDTYKIRPERKEDVWTYYQNPVEIETLAHGTEINFEFQQLYPATLNILVDSDVTNLPVKITHYSFPTISIEETDTVIQKRVYIDKNWSNRIRILRKIALNEFEEFYYVIPATNTTEETTHDINIKNLDFADSEQ